MHGLREVGPQQGYRVRVCISMPCHQALFEPTGMPKTRAACRWKVRRADASRAAPRRLLGNKYVGLGRRVIGRILRRVGAPLSSASRRVRFHSRQHFWPPRRVIWKITPRQKQSGIPRQRSPLWQRECLGFDADASCRHVCQTPTYTHRAETRLRRIGRCACIAASICMSAAETTCKTLRSMLAVSGQLSSI